MLVSDAVRVTLPCGCGAVFTGVGLDTLTVGAGVGAVTGAGAMDATDATGCAIGATVGFCSGGFGTGGIASLTCVTGVGVTTGAGAIVRGGELMVAVA